MKNRDTTFLQKLKDNAFYVALGLGLLAVLAVVAVYTVEQNGGQIAQEESDLNKASDYSQITTASKATETNAQTVKKEKATTENVTTQQVTTEAADTEQVTTENTTAVENVENTSEQDMLPVTTDAGELNFSSDKTIAWPVNGEMIYIGDSAKNARNALKAHSSA